MWVLVNSTDKIYYPQIKYLGSDLSLYKNQLVSWSNNKEQSSKAEAINWNYLWKKKNLKEDLALYINSLFIYLFFLIFTKES